ncbi:hypothetical protein KY360_01895 [Candidatus Woesearchaeota archaeon]|nr:hypothetical protein [Candidatus Woesearchaeota archaeon]
MSSIRKLIKHDKYLEYLYGKLTPKYDVLLKKVPLYSKRRRLVGEIDLMGINQGAVDIYEVKCSHRVTKAKHQLNKIKRLISKKQNLRHLFFYCGESDRLLNCKTLSSL